MEKTKSKIDSKSCQKILQRRYTAINDYPINEELARRANDMRSYSAYKEGSATAEYRRSVDKAPRIAEIQKGKVDTIHHERINCLLDLYARKLAENISRRNAIAVRVPFFLAAGGSNFPVRKKRSRTGRMTRPWRNGGRSRASWVRFAIPARASSDVPEVVQKLKLKLESLERNQEFMKAYRKHKTLDSCPGLNAEEIKKPKASMACDWRKDPKPYPAFYFTNNNTALRQATAAGRAAP